MKRSFRLFLLPILFGSAGCTTVDNNVGSLGTDAGPGDGPRQDASGANPASPCATDADCFGGLSCGYPVADGCAAKGVCIQSNFQGAVGPDSRCGCDGQPILPVVTQISGDSASVVFTSAPWSGRIGPCTGIPDAAVPDVTAPDAASVGKDAAQESTSTDAGRVCLYPAGADTSIGAGNGSFVGCRPGSTPDMCDSSSYTMTCQASGLTPVWIPQPASALNCKVLAIPTPSNTLFYCCPCASSPVPDAAVPDAVSVGKDAAPASPEAGAAHQCQVNTDGTCAAVTPNTACTPYRARRYDESAVCLAAAWTTLWCCATAAGDSCGWPGTTGCLQVTTDAGGVTYWTPAAAPSSPPIPGGELCDQSKSAKVASTEGSLCPATPPDAGARSDAAAAIMTPTLPAACTTDEDCCVAMDGCMATGYLVGRAEYSSMVASIAKVGSGNRMCVNCLQPAVQVQCKGGVCAGDEILASASPASLRTSHCGFVAEASGAPAVSPHAPVDAGTSGSSPSAWGCGVR